MLTSFRWNLAIPTLFDNCLAVSIDRRWIVDGVVRVAAAVAGVAGFDDADGGLL